MKLCINGQYDGVRQELSQLPPCTNWLEPGYKMNIASRDDDSDSESDSDDEDMEMDDEVPQLVNDSSANNSINLSNRPNQTEDADGWTTITTKRRQR